MGIEVIALIKPKNDSNFPVVDAKDLKGGYIAFQTLQERNEWTSKYTNRIVVGLLCHVTTPDYYYNWNGTGWDQAEFGGGGNGNVFIQDTPPQNAEGNPATNSIWVDTSKGSIDTPSTEAVKLLRLINILAKRVSLLEYLNQQISSGGFDNNMYDLYGNIVGIDPGHDIEGFYDEEEGDATSQQWDDDNEELLLNTLLSDSAEPTEYQDLLPNVKHILVKWGRDDDMIKYKDNFMPAELLWCYNTLQLWIKDPFTGQLVRIGNATSNSGSSETIEIMNGIAQDLSKNYITGITFVDMLNSQKHYTFSVLNGELNLYDEELNTYPKPPSPSEGITRDNMECYSMPYIPTESNYYGSGLPCSMVGLNAVYGASYSTYNPCDYNFVEIANQTPEDINLNGMYLHYTQNSLNWITLPLKGKIKAYSTYLVRGAKAGDTQFAAVKVLSAHQYWTKDVTLGLGAIQNSDSLFDSDGYIKFNSSCSFLLTGPLTPSVEGTNDTITPTLTLLESGLSMSAPWVASKLVCGFMDLVGFGEGTSCMVSPTGKLDASKLYTKYYNLDPVSQAYKSVVSNKSPNNTFWTYIDLNNPSQDLNLDDWTLTKEGHNLFFDKHKISDGCPSIVTCTFGYNPHTTRCFTWVSKGYRDEYIKFRKVGDNTWTYVESFKAGDGRATKNNRENAIYNRLRAVASDGTRFTVHRIILDFTEPTDAQTYEYQVGYEGNYSPLKTFTLRNKLKTINDGFSFVQVTDQQGFNAQEYNTWRLAAEYINQQSNVSNTEESKIHFTLNTGDATQNGNRMGEWIDYFNSGDSLFNHLEQMYTVGNNDLCPIVPQEFGNGADTTKCNHINVQYFFTFEHPYDIPKSSTGIYVPCVYSFVYGNTYFLCMNSEITDSTNDAAYKLFGQNGKALYLTLKTWADSDLTHLPSTIKWKVAYCHENPFTLLIADVFSGYVNGTDTTNWRGDVTSHFNKPGDYWFSKFLEDNEFNLSLCGHKHTFSTSYYLHDNPDVRMKPYVWDEGQTISTEGLQVVNLTSDTNKHYVKYTMCQATGYKLVSNKELPCTNIGWLESYYPKNGSNPHSGQKYPHYIVWNIGSGKETNTSNTGLTENRDRILGKVKKLSKKDGTSMLYTYNSNVITVKDIKEQGGNGPANNGDDNILVVKLPKTTYSLGSITTPAALEYNATTYTLNYVIHPSYGDDITRTKAITFEANDTNSEIVRTGSFVDTDYNVTVEWTITLNAKPVDSNASNYEAVESTDTAVDASITAEDNEEVTLLNAND